jgi:hypothetical protein
MYTVYNLCILHITCESKRPGISPSTGKELAATMSSEEVKNRLLGATQSHLTAESKMGGRKRRAKSGGAKSGTWWCHVVP